MWKFKKVLPLVAILVFALVLPAFAIKITALGNYNSDGTANGNYDLEIDNSGRVRVYGAQMTKYELIATNISIGVTQSGTTFAVRHGSTAAASLAATITVTLPTAAVGVEYTIVSAGDEYILVDPAAADMIYYAVSNIPLDAGDSIKSPGTTGDSVTLICPVATKWAVKAMVGSWTDGGGQPVTE